MVALLIRSTDAVRYFDIITVTTNGGPADATKTVPLRLYESGFRFFDIDTIYSPPPPTANWTTS